jgi:hypothetical protein
MSALSGFPERSEAAPYYFGYIDRIKTDDVVGVLDRQLGETLPWLRAVSEERSLHRYEPDKWSIRQLPPEGWTRSGIASGNFFTTRALAYLMAGHLDHHLAVLRERYRS